MIRALAVRTMGCIRVAKIVDYMQIPAVTPDLANLTCARRRHSVAKLYDLSPEMCQEYTHRAAPQLIADPNPMVVANALGC